MHPIGKHLIPTSTSAFGVSKRENHDASGFYGRFTPPEISEDSEVGDHRDIDKLIVGDARLMDEVPDASVALVVTSPPYFAGKEYELALGKGGVPGTYLEYLDLLREVFSECVKKLEPGGRIAVNVANLGRRPYRSLSADVIGILQDDLRLLLRGEIIWVKQRGSSGSCAWGSFQRPGNPVLRDLTERVIVASKARFDRAVSAKERARRGLPSESSMTKEDFMENTLDLWEIPPESATRVGHPAPFPIELPLRLIELYTYRGDLVLDPFVDRGRWLCGHPERPTPTRGVEVDFTARDFKGRLWFFDVAGSFTSHRPGLTRTDILWKALGKAAVLHEVGNRSLVLLTTNAPKWGAGAEALSLLVGPNKPIRAVIEMLGQAGIERLRAFRQASY